MKTSRTASSTARKRQAGSQQPARGADPADEEPIERAADAPHYQTFTVRFLVDQHAVCRRTEVAHVQEGASEAWAGYDQARLAQWIAERVQPLDPDMPVEVPEDSSPPEVTLFLRNLRVTAGESSHLVVTGQPITLSLELELTGEAACALSLPYTVTAYAYNLAGGSCIIGELRGQSPIGAASVVELEGCVAQAGTYRVGVTVALVAREGSATLSGGLLQVYEEGNP